MRKLLLVNIAVAALASGTLMSDRADATTLGTAAGLRSAADGAGPIEQVTYGYRYKRYHRSYAYPYAYPYPYEFRSYALYPRRIHKHKRLYRDW